MEKLFKSIVFVLYSLIFLSGYAYAQESYLVQGIVSDSLGIPLPLAIIQAKLDGNLKAFSTSDLDGKYQLRLPESGTYELQCQSVGFTPFSVSIEVKIPIHEVDIVLSEEVRFLEGIEIVESRPEVILTKDTIKYQLGELLTGDERTLSDLLEKLPGVRIENGTIYANGQRVDKLLIDGKEFFVNQHKLALDNIESDMLAGVNLLEDYEDISKEPGNDKKTIALDLRLEKKYKNRLNGSVEGFGGIKNRYHAHGKSLFFGKHVNVSFITDFNNTGQEAFSFEDFLSTAASSSLGEGGSGAINISPQLNTILFNDNDATERKTNFGIVNIGTESSNKYKVHFYSLLGENQQDRYSQTIRSFFGNEAIIENISTGKVTDVFSTTFISASIKPVKKLLIRYEGSYAPFEVSRREELSVLAQDSTTSYLIGDKHHGNQWNQAFSLRHTFHDSLYLQAGYALSRTDKDQFYTQVVSKGADNFTLGQMIPGNSTIHTPELSLHATTRHFASTSTAGYSYDKNQIALSLSSDRDTLLPVGSGYAELIMSRIYLSQSLSKGIGKIFFRAGLRMEHNKTQQDDQLLDSNLRKSMNWLPFGEIRYSPAQGRMVQVLYQKEVTFPSVDQMLRAGRIIDYQQLNTQGLNLALPQSSHQLRVFGYFVNPLEGINISFNSFYHLNDRFVTTQFDQLIDGQISTYQFVYGQNQRRIHAGLLLSKKINKVKIDLRPAYSFNIQALQIGEEIGDASTSNKKIEVKLHSQNKGTFNVQLGGRFEQSVNQQSNTEIQSKFNEWAGFAKLLFKTSAGIDGSLSFEQQQYLTAQDISLTILDFNLHYQKEGSRFSIELIGSNLLNLSSNRKLEVKINTLYLDETIYGFIPGYLLIGGRWSF